MKCVKNLFLVPCILAMLSPLTNSLTDGSEKVIDQHQKRISLGNHDLSAPCADLSGTWYNQLGSKLILENLGDPVYPVTLGGTYTTAVYLSTPNGTVKLLHHDLGGTTTQSGLVTFRVIWNKKQPLSTSVAELRTPATLTTWIGQCVECDGQETMRTTWILTEAQNTCQDMWKANRIGQDTFKRQR